MRAVRRAGAPHGGARGCCAPRACWPAWPARLPALLAMEEPASPPATAAVATRPGAGARSPLAAMSPNADFASSAGSKPARDVPPSAQSTRKVAAFARAHSSAVLKENEALVSRVRELTGRLAAAEAAAAQLESRAAIADDAERALAAERGRAFELACKHKAGLQRLQEVLREDAALRAALAAQQEMLRALEATQAEAEDLLHRQANEGDTPGETHASAAKTVAELTRQCKEMAAEGAQLRSRVAKAERAAKEAAAAAAAARKDLAAAERRADDAKAGEASVTAARAVAARSVAEAADCSVGAALAVAMDDAEATEERAAACNALEARLEEAEAALRLANEAFESATADRDRLQEALAAAEGGRRAAEGRVRRLARAVKAVIDSTGNVTDRAARLSSPCSPMRELQRAFGEMEEAGLVTPSRPKGGRRSGVQGTWSAASTPASKARSRALLSPAGDLEAIRRSALKSAETAAAAAAAAAEAREEAAQLEAEWQAAECAASLAQSLPSPPGGESGTPSALAAMAEATATAAAAAAAPTPCAESELLRRRVAEAFRRLDAADSRVVEAEQRADEAAAQAERWRAQVAFAEEKARRAEEDAAKARAEMAAHPNAEELIKADETHAAEVARRQALESAVIAAEQELQRLRSAIDGASKNVRDTEARCTAVEKAGAEALLSSERRRRHAEAHKAALTEKCAVLERKLRESERRVVDANEAVDAMRAQHREMAESVHSREMVAVGSPRPTAEAHAAAQAEAAATEAAAALVERMREQLNASEEQQRELLAQLETAQSDARAAKLEVLAAKEQSASLIKAVDETAAAAKAAAARGAKAEAEVQHADARAAAASAEAHTALRELEHAKRAADEYKVEASRALDMHSGTVNRAETLERLHADEVARFTEAAQRSAAALDASNAKCERLQKKLDSANERIEALKDVEAQAASAERKAAAVETDLVAKQAALVDAGKRAEAAEASAAEAYESAELARSKAAACRRAERAATERVHSLESERDALDKKVKSRAAFEKQATSAAEELARVRSAKRNAERRASAAEAKIAEALKKQKEAEEAHAKLRKRSHTTDVSLSAIKAQYEQAQKDILAARAACDEAERKQAAATNAASAADARAGALEEGAAEARRTIQTLNERISVLESAASEAVAQATKCSAKAADAEVEAAAATSARRAAAALREERDAARGEAERARERCARLAPLRDEVVRLRARAEASTKERALFKRAVKVLKKRLEAAEAKAKARGDHSKSAHARKGGRAELAPIGAADQRADDNVHTHTIAAPAAGIPVPAEHTTSQEDVVEGSHDSADCLGPEDGFADAQATFDNESGAAVHADAGAHAHADASARNEGGGSGARTAAGSLSNAVVDSLASELLAARRLAQGLIAKTQQHDHATEALLSAICDENAQLKDACGANVPVAEVPLLPPSLDAGGADTTGESHREHPKQKLKDDEQATPDSLSSVQGDELLKSNSMLRKSIARTMR